MPLRTLCRLSPYSSLKSLFLTYPYFFPVFSPVPSLVFQPVPLVPYEHMTENELASFLLDKLSDLERLENAPDRDAEIAYQKKYLLAKLQSLGIPTEKIVTK